MEWTESLWRILQTLRSLLRNTAQSIIDILVSAPHCTRTELCSRLGKSDGTIKEHLAKLQERGIIQRVGPDFGGYWKVLIRN